ncbi:MAG TPA: FAD-binding oxidoreductase [Pyrinomonadaceae bacterium]|nr:FAD-binding oxidoreductase [Pyrinomonadaceae bacterium]HMP65967.1 FAD-binding oxidoreductase [Pyrinomonadaceae bacterium]
MQVKTQVEDLQNYLTDASNMPGGYAERLFVPETAEDVAAVLREANEAGVAVTISGARTGTVGGAVPFGGYLISLERLNVIKSIDRTAMTAVVEPGVVLADFTKAVEAEGLFYPPDPTEWSCQIGGTVATNASGARSFKYGATREFVQRLEITLADGDTLTLSRSRPNHASNDGTLNLTTNSGRTIALKIPTYKRPSVRKNVSGYFNGDNQVIPEAVDLFIGSEGTLGVITEIELRLINKPKGSFSGIVFFKDNRNLLAFVEEAKGMSFGILESEIQPQVPEGATPFFADWYLQATLIEYFDDQALAFIKEKFPETPEGMAGAIFFEQETSEETEDVLLEQWNALLEKHNADLERSWFTTTEQDRERMREFRHALPVAVNERVVRNKKKKIGTDMAVPDENFAGFLKYQKQLLDASGIDYVIFGHIGDCHLHANLLPKDDAEAVRSRHIYGRFIAQAIMLGGCVSAEHGIGKLKAKYLYVAMGERYLNEMAELKRAFDPKGILGRGNLFGLENRY